MGPDFPCRWVWGKPLKALPIKALGGKMVLNQEGFFAILELMKG